MKVLIIKITSMGDILHTFPALTAAKAARPEVSFDWVVAPEFADLLQLHPAVSQAIPCPIRRWRGHYWQALQQGEVWDFIKNLRQKRYDVIIDAQSALKSAVIGKIARGAQSGYDKNSVREYGAHWFYTQRFAVEKQQHAVTRLCSLFAKALLYPIDPHAPENFGIDFTRLPTTTLLVPAEYVMIIPNTTWPTKHWPDAHWNALLQKMNPNGIAALIPWGNALEKQRAEGLAANNRNVFVLPKLTLMECASLIAKAKAAVCVDTGLGHLAAALGTPAIHLYGPTHPEKIGARGPAQIALNSRTHCKPTCKRICHFTQMPSEQAQCLQDLSVDEVWQKLTTLLQQSSIS